MDRVLRDADSGQGDGVGLNHQALRQVETFEESAVLRDCLPETSGRRAGGGAGWSDPREGGGQ